MEQRFIAIDQSTSSTKALLFDEQCKVLARTNVDHKQYYPQTGWVEHDAEEIYQNMIEAIRLLSEELKVKSEEFAAAMLPAPVTCPVGNSSLFTFNSSLKSRMASIMFW